MKCNSSPHLPYSRNADSKVVGSAATGANLNEILIRGLALYGNESHAQGVKGLIRDLIGVVSRKQRYTLLCLIMKHAARPSVDLNDMEQLKASFSEVWPCRFFTDMEKIDARILLKQLIRFRYDSYLLELEGNSLFNHYPTPGLFAADPGLLQILLDRGEPGAVSQAEQGISISLNPSKPEKVLADQGIAVRKHQIKSSTSREQTDRAFYAKSAMYYAIASGSLAMYHDVVKWSRRFIRDPVSVCESSPGDQAYTVFRLQSKPSTLETPSMSSRVLTYSRASMSPPMA